MISVMHFVGGSVMADSEGAEVRVLSNVLNHAEAKKKFDSGAPYADVKKVREATEPETGSDFFKLLAKMCEASSHAVQVREILRIRTDKIARQLVLETYESLVDFMRLADVEPPKPKC